MKFSVATFFAVAVSAIYAQTSTSTTTTADAGIACNKPGFGEVITAGQPYSLTWTVTNTNIKTISSIALMSGTSSNLQIYIANILSSTIPTSDGQYAWNVPTNIETGSSYALAFKGDNGQTTYSTYFTIMGAAVGTVNKNATSASAIVSGSHSASASQSSQSTSSASFLKIGMAGCVSAAALLL